MTLSVPEDEQYLPVSTSFNDLINSEDALWTFDSEDLIEKVHLIGVPFVITEVAYRYVEQPDPVNPKAIVSSDYVSVTARVGSQDWLDKARARAAKLNVAFPDIDAESFVVFNDGSTGIRRQLTALLHHAKLIDVGGDATQGDSRYDRKFFDFASAKESDDGEMIPPVINSMPNGKPLVIKVLKGLRVSEYAYGTSMATTYYLS